MNGPLPFCARLTNPHGAAHLSVNVSPSVMVAGSAAKLVIGCGALAVQAVTGTGVGVGAGVGVVPPVGPVGPPQAATATVAKSKNRRNHCLRPFASILDLATFDAMTARRGTSAAISRAPRITTDDTHTLAKLRSIRRA